MLSEVLLNIMGLKTPDQYKEKIMTALLANLNDPLDERECEETLDIGFRWVLNGDRVKITSMGWIVLQHLRQVQHNAVKNLMGTNMIEQLLTTDVSQKAEVPLVVAWCLSIMSTSDSQEFVGYHITKFVRDNTNGDVMVLANTAKLLCEYPRCIPRDKDCLQLCTVIITNLATLPIPPQRQVGQFIEQVKLVEILLLKIWEESEEELVLRCLAFLHSILVDPTAKPCPALASVIHVVDQSLINKAVRAILRSDHGHTQILRCLCDWMICWSRGCLLKPWVIAMMNGLEAERQFGILMEVTLLTVEKLFMALLLPAIRPGIMTVVWRMLASTRQTPQVFHKVVGMIPTVTTPLLRENSESSHECLQMIISMCNAYMSAFPRNDNMYEPVEQALKNCAAFLPAEEFAPEFMPNWCEGVDIDTLGSLNPGRSESNRVGLNNLGNTCYMNSVLQALFMSYRFSSAVLESDTQSQPLLTELQVLFALLLRSHRQAISPSKLLRLARPPGFQPGHQQDSSEFLTYFLDVLHEQEKLASSPVDPVVGAGGGDIGTEVDIDEKTTDGALNRWTTEEDLSTESVLQRKAHSLADVTQATGDEDQQLSNSHSNSTDSGIQSVCGEEATATSSSPVPYESLVQRIFGGQMLMSFKCLQCQAESVHTDHFRDIQLAFPPSPHEVEELHIQDMLDYFLLPEHLTGDNRYRCDSCGGLRDAQRSLRILQYPSHLVLTLKCFQFNSKTGQRAKLLQTVKCSESIMLSNQKYTLYACVVHSGSSMDTGHYYTIARDQSQAWYEFNDSTVGPCKPPPWSIVDTPYILFYARPEEHLQPSVDMKSLPPLQPYLMDLVHHDYLKWLQDLQGEEEIRRRRSKPLLPCLNRSYNNDKGDGNGGDPPGTCGGGGPSLENNPIVF